VSREKPWELDFELPKFDSAAEYKQWASRPTTKYLAYNCAEGADPTQRVTSQNPVRYLHGMCVDWDAKFSDDEYKAFIKRVLDSAHPVNYVSRSYSGGIHAVWLFEHAVLSHGKKPMEKFLRRLAKEFKLDKLARGFDAKEFANAYGYLLHGHDWKAVKPKARIPQSTLHYWQFETSKGTDFQDGAVIPLDEVKAELDKQYPGAWEGPFQDGSAGVRFWDSTADNDRAAVVRERGFQCFTGDRPFMSWGDVLGTDFVRHYEVGRIGAAIERYWFDGKNYFIEDDAGSFVVNGKDDTLLDLQGRHNLSNRPRRDDTLSEARRALYQVHTTKRVEAGIPFAFTQSKIVVHEGQRYFNTARVRPLTPSDDAVEWGEGFPTISEWLTAMLGEEQLQYELAWLSYAYTHALKGKPQRGQCHFLCGAPNSGKTLYNKCVLGGLFGGGIKASEYLCGKNDWTDYLFEYGMWLVDDEAPSESPAMHTAFTAKLKEHVANDTFLITGKFKKSGRAFWRGRISITLNDDALSMRLLPDLDMSIKDKLIILKCEAAYKFEADTREKVESELPYFARYLKDYVIPEDMREVRFGVKAYVNSSLEAMAMADSRYSHITELLTLFRQTLHNDFWEGTCSDLLVVLNANENNRVLLKDVNPRKLGWGLNYIFSKGLNWLSKPRHRTWRVEGE